MQAEPYLRLEAETTKHNRGNEKNILVKNENTRWERSFAESIEENTLCIRGIMLQK